MSWTAYPVSGLMVALAVAAQNTWAGWLLLMGRAPDLPLATVVPRVSRPCSEAS
jgi:hypothetical protein